jgi:hypothetical protein
LLCVRLKEVVGCSWSGGFPVDNVDSFHINIRYKKYRPVVHKKELCNL